jgi:nucleotide-binding universal stress UspA family protein
MVGERSPAAGLHRLAKDRDAAAIVVGVSHAHGVARILPGSATEQVLHAAPCAVAVAEPGWRRQAAPGTVAVAYDGSVEAEAALARAASIAAARGSELQIVGAVEPVIVWGAGVAMAPVLLLDEEDRLRDRIDEAAARVTGVDAVSVCCREGRPVRVIRDAAADADLLVIGSRAHGPLQRVLLGTVSAPLVRDPPCAMLVLPRTAVPVSRPSVPAAHAEPASGAR